MRALVVYESMFGNTHTIARHIAGGIDTVGEATVVSVHEATPELVAAADLVVIGGPTHVHGMSSGRSRDGAIEQADEDDDLELDPDALGDGLRDWFERLGGDAGSGHVAVAFDTRVHASPFVTGQASKGITKRLRKHGFELLHDGATGFVGKSNHLEPDEASRAIAWGRSVAETAQTAR